MTEPHAVEYPMKDFASWFVPYEALVKFKGGVSQERIASILKDNRTDAIAEPQRGRLYHVRVLDDRSVESDHPTHFISGGRVCRGQLSVRNEEVARRELRSVGSGPS